MYIEDRIQITAAPQRIYDLGARVEDWPRLLSHYRRVTVLREREGWRLVTMAASRDGFPVSWVSTQECDPVARTIRYRHVRGITRGMVVEWRITPGDGQVDVCISHDFAPPWPPLIGPLVAQRIVLDLFVHNIAQKTLQQIKTLAERDEPIARRQATDHFVRSKGR